MDVSNSSDYLQMRICSMYGRRPQISIFILPKQKEKGKAKEIKLGIWNFRLVQMYIDVQLTTDFAPSIIL
jgi:hypothetical protein